MSLWISLSWRKSRPRPRKADEKKTEPPEEPKKPQVEVPEIKPDSEKSKTAYLYPPIELLNAGVPVDAAAGPTRSARTSRGAGGVYQLWRQRPDHELYARSGCHALRGRAEPREAQKLTSLADDIALSLGASGVRIGAMPNKISTVGIEVPNKTVSTVYLRDIIDSTTFKRSASKLTFAVGKNIGGEAIVGDITKLPHLLVAGTTGSGKSVCLNSLILSILYKSTPEDVRFIMIDPKMVEFRVYNGIPHLLVPVVTEVKKAAGALQWAVVEMMKRYRVFSESNARDSKATTKSS
jgi:S-DNA-T family DNA segregation ATPase FtsK/SpoIIIE